MSPNRIVCGPGVPVAFPVARCGTKFNLFGTALNTDPIRDFTEACFLRSAFATTVIPVPAAAPKATAQETITMDQVIDPLVTDLHWNVHTAHKSSNLLRAPMFLQSFSYPVRQPLYLFVALAGGSTPGVRLMLRHLRFEARTLLGRNSRLIMLLWQPSIAAICRWLLPAHAGPKSGIVVSGSVVGTSSLLHFGR